MDASASIRENSCAVMQFVPLAHNLDLAVLRSRREGCLQHGSDGQLACLRCGIRRKFVLDPASCCMMLRWWCLAAWDSGRLCCVGDRGAALLTAVVLLKAGGLCGYGELFFQGRGPHRLSGCGYVLQYNLRLLEVIAVVQSVEHSLSVFCQLHLQMYVHVCICVGPI